LSIGKEAMNLSIFSRLGWILGGAAICALGLGACATSGAHPPGAGPESGSVVKYEMDPIRIDATKGPAGMQIEAYDAPELFEQAGVALSDKRFDVAAKLYAKLLKGFADSGYARASLYNMGLAHIGSKNWAEAIAAFKGLIEKYPTHADAKDASFQLGACYAEQANWPASAEVFARILERSDLSADDRIEALARRGFAQFNLGDLDAAEKTFRAVLSYRQKIENEERLATDFYLAFSQYHLAQISHQRFQAVELRLPEAQMDKDLDQKASLLLQAQRAYIETIKYGNPAWASAAGFQVGSLYEQLYDAFMRAPIPPELQGEAREVYQEELHKKIRVLLEKSMRWQRENLLMIERLGVNTDWAEKSKLAYAKLLKLLEPKIPGAPTDLAAPAVGPEKIPAAVPPPIPPAPPHRGDVPDRTPPADSDVVGRQVL
jgi:TolA-binding protein